MKGVIEKMILRLSTGKQKAFYVVSVVAAFFIANFLLGGIGALDKAWRRGW